MGPCELHAFGLPKALKSFIFKTGADKVFQPGFGLYILKSCLQLEFPDLSPEPTVPPQDKELALMTAVRYGRAEAGG